MSGLSFLLVPRARKRTGRKPRNLTAFGLWRRPQKGRSPGASLGSPKLWTTGANRLPPSRGPWAVGRRLGPRAAKSRCGALYRHQAPRDPGDSLRWHVEADIPVLPKRVQHRHDNQGPRAARFPEAEAERRLAGSKATGLLCHDVYGARRDPSFLEVGRALPRPHRVVKRIWGSRGSLAGPAPGACPWPLSDLSDLQTHILKQFHTLSPFFYVDKKLRLKTLNSMSGPAWSGPALLSSLVLPSPSAYIVAGQGSEPLERPLSLECCFPRSLAWPALCHLSPSSNVNWGGPRSFCRRPVGTLRTGPHLPSSLWMVPTTEWVLSKYLFFFQED